MRSDQDGDDISSLEMQMVVLVPARDVGISKVLIEVAR